MYPSVTAVTPAEEYRIFAELTVEQCRRLLRIPAPIRNLELFTRIMASGKLEAVHLALALRDWFSYTA